jgi:hypothetical protein
MSDALDKNARFQEAVAKRALRVSEAVNLPVFALGTLPKAKARREQLAFGAGLQKRAKPSKPPPPEPARPVERKSGAYTAGMEGEAARRAKRPASSNPYDREVTPSLHWQWLRGWERG